MNAKKLTVSELKNQVKQGILENGHVLVNGIITEFNIDATFLKGFKILW